MQIYLKHMLNMLNKTNFNTKAKKAKVLNFLEY